MLSRVFPVLERACLVVAGAALFGIMVLTFLDVIGRKLLSQSIPGSLELTELLMVAVIFGALPAVCRRGEHVQFDSLDPYLPAAVRAVQRVIIAFAALGALAALAALMWITAGQFAVTGETTAQLGILKAPFIYGMAVLCGAAALMHLAAMLGDDAAQHDEQAGEGAAL
jgi:TRAP-type C4-dicarboxylate transport system permease small subunit